MKRKTAAALIAALALGAASSVWAAPSISQIIPENPTVVSGTLSEKQQLVVKNVDTGSYENKKVAAAVEKANDDNTIVTVKEILKDLDVDTKTTEFTTVKGEKVNPTLFEQITPFVDLAIQEGDTVSYTMTGTIKATLNVEAAKGMEKKDIMLMQVDPATGKVFFAVPEEVDAETGKITAEFETLGPVTVLKTVPIVVKETAPEKYENEKAAEAVTKFQEETKGIVLSDVLGVLSDEESGEIEVKEGVTIDPASCRSAMGFADLAIKQGEDYLYDMDGSLEADVRRDLEGIDWERLVKAGYPDFDIDAAKEEPTLLEDLEPFTIEGSFLMQINPVTGEAEYIYEPELFFASADAETEGWSVVDVNSVEGTPDLVIRAEYKSMGPFVLFLPDETM